MALNPIEITIRSQAEIRALSQTQQKLNELHGVLKSIATGVGIAIGQRLTDAFVRLPAAISNAIKQGIQFNATLQDAQLGIAAVLKQFEPEKYRDFQSAMKASAGAIDLLKQKALESPATFQQLVSGFQAVSGAATSAGISLKDQVELIVLLSQTLAGLGIRSEQITQESRALITGNITEDALAARILAITKAQVEQAREQGKLFEFLKEKASAFAEAGKIGANNFTPALSNFQDQVQQTLGEVTKPLFESLTSTILEMTEALKSFAQEAGRVSEWGIILDAVFHSTLDLVKALIASLIVLAKTFEIVGKAIGQFAGGVAGGLDKAIRDQMAETKRANAAGARASVVFFQSLKTSAAFPDISENLKKEIDEALRLLAPLASTAGDYWIQYTAQGKAAIEELALVAAKKTPVQSVAAPKEMTISMEESDALWERAILADREAAEEMKTFDAEAIANAERLLAIRQELADQTFAGRLQSNIRQLGEDWAFVGRNMADVLTRGVGGAVDGLAQGITELILTGKGFGQAMAHVARQIITDLIRMTIQALLFKLIIGPIFGFAGGGFVGGHADGGLIAGAPSSRDNRLAAVATGEHITRAAAVQYYGPGLFAALNSMRLPRDLFGSMRMPMPRNPALSFSIGGFVPAFNGGANSPQNISVAPAPVNVYFVQNEKELFRLLESERGRQIIVHQAGKSKTELGIPS